MKPAWLHQALGALNIGRLLVFFLLLIPLVDGFHPLVDPDLWWHLKTGEWIVEHRAVPWTDPFSYSAEGRSWIAYSWLAEVLFYEIVRIFGFSALIYLKAVLLVSIVGVIYLSCRAVGARLPAAVLTTALAAMASAGTWTERPQLFTMLFLAILVWGLHAPWIRCRIHWLAPALIGLWANIHILFIAGIVLLAFATACAALEHRATRVLAIATALSLPATLVNPYGWQLFAHLPTIAGHPYLFRMIVEFRSPDFATPFGIWLAVFLLFAIAALSLSSQRMTWFELVTFLGSLAMGLYMVRNVPLFAILAAPTVARHAETIIPVTTRADGQAASLRLAFLHGVLLITGLAFALGLRPRGTTWRETVEPKSFPVAAADFIAERRLGPRLFNHFDWGGFLIYRLFPQARVSIDGRTTVYGKEMLHAYERTQSLADGWERFLDDCHPDVVVWPNHAPLAIMLRTLPAWRVIYEDDIAVVFARAADHLRESLPQKP